MAVSRRFLPGASIGIVGTGQLGRMMALAARPMGYSIVAMGPGGSASPLGQVSDRVMNWTDAPESAWADFARAVDVVTFEFENIPHATLDWLSGQVAVHPSPNVLLMKQDRLREKQTLSQMGFPVAPFAPVDSVADLEAAVKAHDLPGVLKTRQLGYDGKGQVKLNPGDALAELFVPDPSAPVVFEAWMPHDMEISVIGARNAQGEFAAYAPIENQHRNHILDVSLVPARVSPQVAAQAKTLLQDLMTQLDYVGLLCVELFVLPGDRLVINEIAPRPHNSGHLTIEASLTSQFEQHIRAICNLSLGDTHWMRPTAMLNLLGESFDVAQARLDWILQQAPSAKFHSYGKAQTVAGRKMGHLTVPADTVETSLMQIEAIRRGLETQPTSF